MTAPDHSRVDAGVDKLVGGAGNDRFVFTKGEAAGDAIQDFKHGDLIELHGYSAGSTLTRVAHSTTDWVITDHATGATEVIHLINGAPLPEKAPARAGASVVRDRLKRP